MDLRKLKKYMGSFRNNTNDCYLIENNYVITDGYSVVCLKDNYDLNVIADYENGIYRTMVNYLETFENLSSIGKLEDINYTEEDYKIDNDYGILIKNIKRIKNLIKANNIELLINEGSYTKYIIKIENTKTKEVGYLLPTRKY